MWTIWTIRPGSCIIRFGLRTTFLNNLTVNNRYDDENRLIDVQNLSVAYETVFIYDGLGRLRIRREYQGPPSMRPFGAAVPTSSLPLVGETRYIYDGLRVIQERDSNNVPLVSYTRGVDLSGTLEGLGWPRQSEATAGGIGGLLARSHGYSSGNWTNHNYYHADGNGNITYLVNSSQGLAATYRYDPFGNTISSSGTLAAANVYRFSSKELHANSGLYYYLYRFYDPNTQRWLNRDSIDEPGFEPIRDRAQREVQVQADGFRERASTHIPLGLVLLSGTPMEPREVNLYTYVANTPTAEVDAYGLELFPPIGPRSPLGTPGTPTPDNCAPCTLEAAAVAASAAAGVVICARGGGSSAVRVACRAAVVATAVAAKKLSDCLKKNYGF
ncbi:MAG TPA: RHS repeat-associated core domain-containing protein [Verrucomicrobiae bacterium]